MQYLCKISPKYIFKDKFMLLFCYIASDFILQVVVVNVLLTIIPMYFNLAVSQRDGGIENSMIEQNDRWVIMEGKLKGKKNYCILILHRLHLIILILYLMADQLPEWRNPSIEISLNRINHQRQNICTHLHSAMLPKIGKATILCKNKNSEKVLESQKKALFNYHKEEKGKKMIGVMSDYLQIFRKRQKGPFLAISRNKRTQKKSIRVDGISHSKFIGVQTFSEMKNYRRLSFDNQLKREKIPASRSFMQKIKTQIKTDYEQRNKMCRTETSQLEDIKNYVLQAKKSLIDCKKLTREKKRIQKSI